MGPSAVVGFGTLTRPEHTVASSGGGKLLFAQSRILVQAMLKKVKHGGLLTLKIVVGVFVK